MGEIADSFVEKTINQALTEYKSSPEDHKIKRVQATFNVSYKTAQKIRRIQLQSQEKSLEIKELKAEVGRYRGRLWNAQVCPDCLSDCNTNVRDDDGVCNWFHYCEKCGTDEKYQQEGRKVGK